MNMIPLEIFEIHMIVVPKATSLFLKRQDERGRTAGDLALERGAAQWFLSLF